MKTFKAFGRFMAVVVCILILAEAVYAVSKDEEDRFIADVKEIMQKKDLPALLKLVCWDQVNDKTKKMVEGHLRDLMKKPILDVTLTEAGFPFKNNLEVIRRLNFVHKATGESSESSFVPVGEKNGKLMIAVTIEEQ
jgi:geranylgeranyl pyrophosphate synthase